MFRGKGLLAIAILTVAIVGCGATATAAQAKTKTNSIQLPVNDGRAKAAANRAWSLIKGIDAQDVVAARMSCSQQFGDYGCQGEKLLEYLIDTNSPYRRAIQVHGNEVFAIVMSLSTATSFSIRQGSRTCDKPGVGGCPRSGIWGKSGFSLQIKGRKLH